jgi:glycine oxidase
MVGATSEEMGFDKRTTAGGIYSVLDGAWEVVPGIYDLPLNGVRVGLRPGSRDNLPIVGKSDVPGVYFATGHYRHGVLHTALTSEEIALEISDSYESPWLADFRPQRF